MRRWLPPVLLATLLCGLSAAMPVLEPLFQWVQPDKQSVIYERESFLFLLQNHLTLVLLSAAVGTVAAVAGGIFATRPTGRDFLPLVSQVASIGQIPWQAWRASTRRCWRRRGAWACHHCRHW